LLALKVFFFFFLNMNRASLDFKVGIPFVRLLVL
jgi:hypothetical protein